jgi:hypothetical protein
MAFNLRVGRHELCADLSVLSEWASKKCKETWQMNQAATMETELNQTTHVNISNNWDAIVNNNQEMRDRSREVLM